MAPSPYRSVLKRMRLPKGRNIARLYRENKCRACSVVVTRMDFAKILGKFTKVKIQYESSDSPKSKRDEDRPSVTSITNARLKSNENGMVLLHRTAYNQHPVKEILKPKKPTLNAKIVKRDSDLNSLSNVLKENNRLKRTVIQKDKNSNYERKRQINHLPKQYRIIFVTPEWGTINDIKSSITLIDLLPIIKVDILPTDTWCIDYLPKDEEPKEDHVYDRIAAELQDLMYNNKETAKEPDKIDDTTTKINEFPSILDILNDSPSENVQEKCFDHNNPVESDCKENLQSSDVEAMLLGETKKESELEATKEDINSNPENTLPILKNEKLPVIDEEIIGSQMDCTKPDDSNTISVIDEALKKGIEEQLTGNTEINKDSTENENHTAMNEDEQAEKQISKDLPSYSSPDIETLKLDSKTDSSLVEESADSQPDVKEHIENGLEQTDIDQDVPMNEVKSNATDECVSEEKEKVINFRNVTHVVFKQLINGDCCRSVICPKSLKYSIEIEGKPVELLGAPKHLSSLEDLKVLLQIVNDSELDSFNILQ